MTVLWLENDEHSYRYWRSVTQECREMAPTASQVLKGYWTVEEAARFTLTDRLREEIETGSPVVTEGTLYADLLCAALEEVNWGEIAYNYLADE